MKIDQALQVALQAGKKSNVFIYHAPTANIRDSQIPNEYNGPMQILYALCSELLNQDITIKEWKKLSRAMMFKAAFDKHGSKLAAARALGIKEFKAKDIALLEEL